VQVLEGTPNLFLREAMVTDVVLGDNDDVRGVSTFFGMQFLAPAVVLTTGTFSAPTPPCIVLLSHLLFRFRNNAQSAAQLQLQLAAWPLIGPNLSLVFNT
jgi:tRNA U34 5-carboxymethylaminomethyl modifying enzyme MnmG/GidA